MRSKSSIHESKVAKIFKGRRTRVSGALSQDKGDVVSHKLQLVVQCKGTRQNKFYVTTKLLDKVIKDAISRKPDYFGGLFVTFENTNSLYKDQFMVPKDFLVQVSKNEIKNDIIAKAVEYKMQSIAICPDSTIYRVLDSKKRVWYIVPALFYKWV